MVEVDVDTARAYCVYKYLLHVLVSPCGLGRATFVYAGLPGGQVHRMIRNSEVKRYVVVAILKKLSPRKITKTISNVVRK